jgi:hypothetical protein
MNKDEILRRYLEGDLSPGEEREALHTIADDPEMRSLLRFEQKLSDSLAGDSLSFDESVVPEGFSAKVMHRIEAMETDAESVSFTDKIKRWYQQLWVPKEVQWRPVYGFVFALLVLFSLSYPLFITQTESSSNQEANLQNLNSSVQQVSSSSDEVMLRFIYIDEKANSVAVAGDFNNWEPVELSKQNVNGEQVWTGLVSMSRGEHNYMFIRNGEEWVTDPLAPVRRDDGFGNKNAVIYL